ncbi:tetratricopeptide repeat protein [Aquitalea sp. ASV15]|uniref:tetratricopeptide repeat protein n=1 Tax=Aquitalea sp. ASV15 TaxID=2795104 RepID=UPI0018EB539B|nr:tetratricopeptide repeat protein [Aquitalea sp. ASV15]
MFRFFGGIAIFFALSMQAHAELEAGLAALKSKDYAVAIKELSPAADNGDASAQHAMGQIYESGLGVKKDPSLAISYYQKAASQGFAKAQLNLGTAYASGVGVEKDYGQAIKWLQKAADQGNPTASHNLAIMYAGGLGVVRDYPHAVLLYRKAIEGGYARSVYNLGVIYANGAPGVPQNLTMAYVVFSVASPNDTVSAGYKGIVGARLTPEQLQKAEKISASLKLGSALPLDVN